MNTEHRGSNMAWHICFAVMLCAFILMVPDYAFAFPVTSNFTPATAPKNTIAPGFMYCTITNFIYGNTGKAVATLAICYLGVKANQGKIEWKTVKLVCIGIAVIFGAAWFANAFIPNVTAMSNICWVARTGNTFTWSDGDTNYFFPIDFATHCRRRKSGHTR